MGRIRVRLTPRAKRDSIEGWRDGTLRVRVVAPPVDGRANAALVGLLADALGVAKGDVTIAAGAGSREKLVAVDGLDEDAIRSRLSG